MITCILIHNKDINEIKVKNLTEETIYKKCNFKNNKDFLKIKSWKNNNYLIELWGKNIGLSNSFNNFELLKKYSLNVYGKCIFIMKNNENKYISLDKENFINFFNLKQKEKEEKEEKEEEKEEKKEKEEEK